MSKTIQLLFFVLSNSFIVFGQEFNVPIYYSVLDSVRGDLDKDGLSELVIAFNTKKEVANESIPREVIIYKKEGKKWNIWKRSNQALLGSQDGGVSGDPFGSISIENNILIISQNGGGSWKWGFTDKYRYTNNEFYLIGYTSTYGRLCDYWKDVDFNLLTGKLIVKKEYENCEKSNQEIYKRENEILLKKGLKITFQQRNEQDIKIVTPKYKHEFYVSDKHE